MGIAAAEELKGSSLFFSKSHSECVPPAAVELGFVLYRSRTAFLD